MIKTVKIIAIIFVLIVTICNGAVISNNNNKHYGNLTNVGAPQPIYVVKIAKINSEIELKLSGASVGEKYIITHSTICTAIKKNREEWKTTLWNDEEIKDIKIQIFNENETDKIQIDLCIIEIKELTKIEPVELRVFKHRVKPKKTLQTYDFVNGEQAAISVPLKEAKTIFPNEKIHNYLLLIKFDKTSDILPILRGTIVTIQKTEKSDKLVAVVGAAKKMEDGYYALCIELSAEKVAKVIEKNTDIHFRRKF